MYVIYLDESGDPNGWNNNQNHFILGGMAVHEGQIEGLRRKLDEVQGRFFPDISVPLKFHAVDVNNGRDRFRGLEEQDRQRILESIYDVIAQTPYPGLVLFATAMHISAVIDPEQALRATLEDIVQRVNTFLVRLNNQGNPQKALLVIDRSQSTESRYRTYISDFRRQGTAYGYIGNIVDIPYFSQSADTRLLQFADFCAYAVFRYYERVDDEFLRRILPKFDRRSPNHPPDGLKHIIRSSSCLCKACCWRT